ncbi:hypothetical protein DBV15_00494 [Temnothorax longispinosus]|uniref:Uncharacterized protein n=1 Tax=Temnothorax longispinosus TaxID=300112 RepID=A0A4S2JVY5_9HYME|nr:hypothetical protein DBV15_00494 [Temnothorax longispinosus]
MRNANPGLPNSPCNPAETRGSFPVGKVNKCRGGATGKFEACSEFRVEAQHEVSDGFDASEYTANRFPNFSLCIYLCLLRLIEQIRSRYLSGVRSNVLLNFK